MPAATTLPSGCSAIANAPLFPRGVVTLPPLPKLVSSEPFASKRATANRSPESEVELYPAATILPSGCSASARTLSSTGPIAVVSVPPEPKLVSSEPLAL